MNLPHEYVLRTSRIKEVIKFPCVLYFDKFLKSKASNIVTRKRIVKIDKIRENSFHISKFNLKGQKCGEVPKTNEEIQTNFNGIFEISELEGDKYRLINYIPNEYNHLTKQSSDFAIAVSQDIEYKKNLDNYFFSHIHNNHKLLVIWQAFEKLNISKETKVKYLSQPAFGESYLKQNDQNLYELWIKWKNTFSDNNLIAPELLFSRFCKYNNGKE